jgi:hypothetical protein
VVVVVTVMTGHPPADTIAPPRGSYVSYGTTFDIPGLPGDTHLGMSWFSPPAVGTESAVRDLWGQVSSVSSVGRVMLDWLDVEPERGRYDPQELEEQLDELSRKGLAPMVSIIAVDVSGTSFPASTRTCA